MDIRSSLDGLKALLGVNAASPSAAQRAKPGAASEALSTGADRATLSSAGTEVAQSAMDEGVRTAKVAEIRAALEAGTYQVPASAVAAKMVDGMLERGK